MKARLANVVKRVALGALGAAATSLAVAKVRARRRRKAAEAARAAAGNGVKVTKPAPKPGTMPGTAASIEVAERTKARRDSDALGQKARDRKAQPRSRKAADPRRTHRQTGHRA